MEKQMGNHYTVQVLNDREFDNLPYKGISDSLGIADKEKGLAFVRRTGIKDIDEITLHHEIDELVNKHSNHTDEYGIRHKKGKDIFAKIIPILASIAASPFGPVASAAAGAGTRAITATQMESRPPQGGRLALDIGLAGAGGYLTGSSMGPGMAASSTGSYLGKLGSGLLGTAPTATAAGTKGIIGSGGNLLGMGTKSLAPMGALQGPVTSAQNAIGYNFLSEVPKNLTGSGSAAAFANSPAGEYIQAARSISPYGVYGNPSIPGSAINASSSIPSNVLGSAVGSGIGNMISKATQIPATQAPIEAVSPASNLSNATKTATPGWLETFGKKAGELATPQNILGGTLALGSTMGKQPEFEPVDIESIRTSLLSGEGVSPLGKQARAKLSQIMSAKPGELYPTGTDAYYQSALRQTEVAYQDAQKALAKRYNLIDPNYLQNGEYQELARRLDQELASVKSDYAISEEQRRFELSRTQQYQAIQQALQVDDNTMQELLGFTGLAADQAAKKYAVDANDVNEMRKALGGLGGQILTSEGGILAGKKK